MISGEEKSFIDFLEENYCPEISCEEKTSINGMICSLKRNLNWDLEEDDSLYNKERGPDIIKDVMSCFNSWKSLNDASNNLPDFVGLQHLVISTIAKLCFHYWIKDSEIVADILRQIYISDGHFASMFECVMHENDRRSVSSTEQEIRQKEYQTMVYFLTHAYNAKLEFSGVRIVDFGLGGPSHFPPVILAAAYSNPQPLLLLLRLGANVDRGRVGGRPITKHLKTLLVYLIWELKDSLGTKTKDTTVVSSNINDMCLCLNYLLRGIRQISRTDLEPFLEVDLDSSANTNSIYDFIRSASERRIIPRLRNRYFEPSELQHLCRLAIREALYRNWNLPFGVFSLPLPKVMQRYVNLSED